MKQFPKYNGPITTLCDAGAVITELGVKVLNGSEDWARINETGQWYGGVHLQGSPPDWPMGLSGPKG